MGSDQSSGGGSGRGGGRGGSDGGGGGIPDEAKVSEPSRSVQTGVGAYVASKLHRDEPGKERLKKACEESGGRHDYQEEQEKVNEIAWEDSDLDAIAPFGTGFNNRIREDLLAGARSHAIERENKTKEEGKTKEAAEPTKGEGKTKEAAEPRKGEGKTKEGSKKS